MSNPAPKYFYVRAARGEQGNRAVGYDLFVVHSITHVEGEPLWRLSYVDWASTMGGLVRTIWRLEGGGDAD